MNVERTSFGAAAMRRSVSLAAFLAFMGLSTVCAGGAAASLAVDTPAGGPRVIARMASTTVPAAQACRAKSGVVGAKAAPDFTQPAAR